MTDIKELALQVAKEAPWYFDNEPLGDAELTDFAQRFLVAYLAEQEPVSLYPCGFKELNSLVIKNGAYLARGMNEDEPVTESIRSSAMVLVGYAKDMSDLLAKQPLFTAPPEPAPQQDKQESGDYGLTGSSAACAAPSSEEVRETVERLRMWYRDGGSLTARDAADLIKHLAARAEKYSELLCAVERKFPNETRHETALRYIRQTEERANSGSPTDAAGEVKP